MNGARVQQALWGGHLSIGQGRGEPGNRTDEACVCVICGAALAAVAMGGLKSSEQ